MQTLFTKFLMGIIRHALSFGGGVVVMRGTFDASDMNQIVGALMTIIGILWSAWEKRKTHIEIRRAQLATPKDIEKTENAK